MFPSRFLFLVEILHGTRGWDRACEPHYTAKKSLVVYWSSCGSDQAVCPEELLVADSFGLKERSDHVGVVALYLYYDSPVDSVTLLSSLSLAYFNPTGIGYQLPNTRRSRSIDHLITFYI